MTTILPPMDNSPFDDWSSQATATESPLATDTQAIIRHLVHELPSHMRQQRWARATKDLCDVHQGLNAELMHDLFQLVQREVGHHLGKFDEYPELLRPLDEIILKRLRAIRGMWEQPNPNKPVFAHVWLYEASKCQGCMLSRIGCDRDALRNLRIALLSRTQTRGNHVPRRLMHFIDGCIDQFPDHLDEIYNTSSQFAYILKDTRKACTKAWYKDPEHGEVRRRIRHSLNIARQGIQMEDDYPPAGWTIQPPPVIHALHPAALYVDDSTNGTTNSADKNKEVIQACSQLGSHSHMDFRQASPSFHAKSPIPTPTNQEIPPPHCATRIVDFVEGNHESFQESAHKEPGEPVEPSRDRRVDSEPFDVVDEMIEIYRKKGNAPYRESCCQTFDSSKDNQTDENDEPDKSFAPQDSSAVTTTWSLVCGFKH